MSGHQSPPAVVSPPPQPQQPSPSVAAPAPAPVASATTRPTAPSKSPFDFVSPFDVFDKAPAKPVTPVNGSSSRSEASPKPAQQTKPQQQQQQQQHFAVPPAHINGTVIHPGEAQAAQPRRKASKDGPSLSRSTTNDKNTQQPSPQTTAQTSTPGSTRMADLNLPWKASKDGQTKG